MTPDAGKTGRTAPSSHAGMWPDSDAASGGAGVYHQREVGGGGQDMGAELQEGADPVKDRHPTFWELRGKSSALGRGIFSGGGGMPPLPPAFLVMQWGIPALPTKNQRRPSGREARILDS